MVEEVSRPKEDYKGTLTSLATRFASGDLTHQLRHRKQESKLEAKIGS